MDTPRTDTRQDFRDTDRRRAADHRRRAPAPGCPPSLPRPAAIDLIIIYNSGRFRMAGRGSLSGLMPYGDANAIVMDMAREVLPVVQRRPVLAGVCGTDPFRLMTRSCDEVPRAGLHRGPELPDRRSVRRQVPAEPRGDGHGVRPRGRHDPPGPRTRPAHRPYVFDADQARAMARAGADILVPHMGLTTKGTIGAATALTLTTAAAGAGDGRRGVAVNPDVIVLCHGGPIAEPEDAAYVLENTNGVAGFFGASSMERLPTEVAIRQQAEAFKAITVTASEGNPHDHDLYGRRPDEVSTRVFDWGTIKWLVTPHLDPGAD